MVATASQMKEFAELQALINKTPDVLNNLRHWQRMMAQAYFFTQDKRNRGCPLVEEEIKLLVERHAASLGNSIKSFPEACSTLRRALDEAVEIIRFRRFFLMTSKCRGIEVSDNVVMLRLPIGVLRVIIDKWRIHSISELSSYLATGTIRDEELVKLISVAIEKKVQQLSFAFAAA